MIPAMTPSAELVDREGWVDLMVDGRLLCAFSDRVRAEKALEHYQTCKRGAASVPFVRITAGSKS